MGYWDLREKIEVLDREGNRTKKREKNKGLKYWVQTTGRENIPFCGGRDGTRCGAVSAAPI